MKLAFLATALISTSAFAVNPEFERIYNQYKVTLEHYSVGMTKVEHLNEPSVEISDTVSVTQMVSDVSTVILKVDGLKTYEYSTTVNNTTGEVTTQVTLEDHSFNAHDSDMFTGLKVINNVLFADFAYAEADGEFVWAMKGKMVKDLMESGFCGGSVVGEGSFTMNGQSFAFSQENSANCGPMLEIEEIKKINLKKVTFCDFTVDPNSECEEKDMSFLTSNL